MAQKKSKPVRKQSDAEIAGRRAAEASRKRAAEVINPEERYVQQRSTLDTVLRLPKWLAQEKKAAFTEFLELVCTGNLKNIAELARKHSIDRQTIYNWLAHQDVKDMVDDFLKALATADKPKVYEMILARIPSNPSYARFWAERYEGYQPDQPKSGNITINFNFLNTNQQQPQDEPIQEAEYEELPI